MTATIGLELGPELFRAVRLYGWGRRRVRTLEEHWDPAQPGALVAALRESFGSAERIAITIDLSFLFSKQVRLPALPAEEKQRILALEPERFFPVRTEDLVVAVRGDDNLAFAVRTGQLGSWLEALESFGPVELVEPSPVSLARALGRSNPGAATILMEEGDQRIGIAEIAAGQLRRIRRMHGDPGELASAIRAPTDLPDPVYLRPLNGNQNWQPVPGDEATRQLPSIGNVAPAYLAAYGAALGLGKEPAESLLPFDQRRRIQRRRKRTVALAALACTLAFIIAGLSLDQFRERTLGKLDAEISRLRESAEGALSLQRQAGAFRQQTLAVANLEAQRTDLVGALAALTRRLPPDAYLQTLRSAGADWQIDGYARESAPLLSRFEEDPLFDSVRFLTATSRLRMDGKPYESFSIAFRLAPKP